MEIFSTAVKFVQDFYTNTILANVPFLGTLNNPLLVGIVLAVLGLIFAFCGHKFLLRVLALAGGFFVGYYAYNCVAAIFGLQLPWLGYVAGGVIAIIFCVFAKKTVNWVVFVLAVYDALFYLVPLVKDYLVAPTFVQGMITTADIAKLVAIAAGVLVAALVCWLLRPVFIVATAALGGGLVGAGIVIGFYDMLSASLGAATTDIIAVGVAAVFLVISLIVQLVWLSKHRKRA